MKAGDRGPSLRQDYEFFEKMTRFGKEEIPERVVHARGYGAHGDFECYESMKEYTKAGFLQEAGKKTSVFVRFSTVQGSRGSKDTARDMRCWGTKFYTEEGNYDLTTINMPVKINQDAMKFPDMMHAYFPNPRTGFPQASAAHDNFWDYVANNPESLHQVMWIMSDRGVPRSYRMIESWSINTYLFVNDQGKATFVRFTWKPLLGVHSLLMDEAQKIGGIDPDYHRRDLREAIDRGAYPEYELGVQLIPMEDEFKYDFDVLDPSKFWPEEIVPFHPVGKMTLNKNVDNEFAELEQVAFNPANVVPGIDFSNDPVLQARLIAYQSTQYHRLGANFQDIPINQPVCPYHNNTRRGAMRYRIDVDQVDYHKNSLANNTPSTTPPEEGGYEHYPKKVEGQAIRARSESFKDYFTQPRIFWNSMAPIEKKHTIQALSYQLGRVKNESVRQQNVNLLVNVDKEMACTVADNIGVEQPSGSHVPVTTSYPSLSMVNSPYSASTQKAGILIGDSFQDEEVTDVLNALNQNGIFTDIISEKLGTVTGAGGTKLKVDYTFMTTSPYLLDSIYIVGGNSMNQAKFNSDVAYFMQVAYKHFKPIGVASTGQSFIQPSEEKNLLGVISSANNPDFTQEFISAIGQQRFWERK
ncbi:catalase [Virgibacillus siamensis]|uniref:catalase n=1 Tax=Virgibacillus siamensis TaxID=480071 RepID=A0ABN1GMU8_9BACI